MHEEPDYSQNKGFGFGQQSKGNKHSRQACPTDQSYLQSVCQNFNTQAGSRTLQKLLSTAKPQVIGVIHSYLLPQFTAVSLNLFGNYVAQKLIETADPSQLHHLACEVAGRMPDYCFNAFGCRVVLRLFEYLALDESWGIEGFADSFIEKNILRMIKDTNANYIVQRVIFLQPENKLRYITELFLRDVGSL